MSCDSLFSTEIPLCFDGSGTYSCSDAPNSEWGSSCDGNHNYSPGYLQSAYDSTSSSTLDPTVEENLEEEIPKVEVVDEAPSKSPEGGVISVDGVVADDVRVDIGGRSSDADETSGSECDSFGGSCC